MFVEPKRSGDLLEGAHRFDRTPLGMRTALHVFGTRKKRETAERGEGPRPQHYIFAHEALRGVCRDDPLRFFALMGSESQRELVRGLWALIGKRLGDEASKELDPREIVVERVTVRGFPLLLVSMPTPVAVAEAFFVAIALFADLDAAAENVLAEGEVTFRYFTLELGATASGETRTVLGEWTERGHANYGDGPEPDPTAFLAAVEERLWALLS